MSWPTGVQWQWETLSWKSAPHVARNKMASGYNRQRLLTPVRDDVFNVEMVLTGAQYNSFRNFVRSNLSSFSATYYDCDLAQTGDLRIVNGQYSAKEITNDRWRVNCQVEVINRPHTLGESLYNMAVADSNFDTTQRPSEVTIE